MEVIIHLQALDWCMVGLYAATILGFGFWLSRRPQSSEGYFLAGRQLTWPLIGASLFAANISAEHIVGLAESGYSGGLAVGGFEWMAVFCLAPLVFLFLPFYIQNKIYTVPEFLEKRFSPGVRLAFSGFMMVLSVLTKISISLWAASVVFSKLFGIPTFVADLAARLGWTPGFAFQIVIIWIIGLATVLYTMKGGLRVVVYTDAIQTAILLAAAILLTYLGLREVGGWHGLVTKIDNPAMFDMVKPATDPNYPWPGMFVCVFILGSFYWSMDQVLVQRVFAAKSLNEGRLGAVFCGGLKILTPFLLVLPGLICLALYPGLKEANQAYPKLLSELMPAGLLGLTIAGLTAALMGHISATYNSVATLFTRDIYLKINPQADDRRQVHVGRLACFIVFILGAAWAPMVGNFGGIFTYLQTMQCYLMMPFAGIFFLGVFWKRINAQGVYACLVTLLVLAPVFIYNAQRIGARDTALKSAGEIAAWVESKAKPEANTLMAAATGLVDNAPACGSGFATLPSLRETMQKAKAELAALDKEGTPGTAKEQWLAAQAPALLASLLPLANDVQAAARQHPAAGFLPMMDHPLLRPWLHASFVVFLFCMLALVAASLLTARPAAQQTAGTTVDSLAFFKHEPLPLHKDYRLWFAVIAITTAALWWSLH